MSETGLTLTARLTAAVLDARRGVVRMHQDVLAALDLAPWDPVLLGGRRTTGAIVADGGNDVPPGILLADDLTLGNIGIADGTAVQVAKIDLTEARTVEVAGDANISRIVSPDMLRRALLGKMVATGDNISLLPQENSLGGLVDQSDLDSTRRQLRALMGMQWTTTLLTVTSVDAAGPALVTAGTTVSWRGGGSAPGWAPEKPSRASTNHSSVRQVTPQPNPLYTVTAAPSPPPSSPLPSPPAAVPLPATTPAPSAGPAVVAEKPAASDTKSGAAATGSATKAKPAAKPAQTAEQSDVDKRDTVADDADTGTVATAIPTIADLPGVKEQSHSLYEWLDLGFHHTEVLDRLGSTAQLGVLISGPPGVGKSTLAQSVAASVGAGVVDLSAPAVAAVEAAAAADALRSAIKDATDKSPTMLLIRDVEALAPRDEPEPLSRIFIDLLAHTIGASKVAVVCTTARPEEVSTELLRPGVLDHQLSVPLPDKNGRKDILEAVMRPVPLAGGVHLDEIAARTPGFVIADLIALRREASVRAALRQRESDNPTIDQTDLIGALEVVRPTAMAESSLEVARVTLDDVGDMVETKEALTEAVLWPLQYPETFERLGISPPRGVLLYGPPGCGKTFLVKAIAGSGQTNVMSVKGAELLNKWVGESERAVRELFRRARQASPTLIFMDEVDALAPPRGQGTDGGTTDRVVASLLTELDGVEALKNVVVIGATNRPDLIDPALLRPGRLDRMIYVPPPDADARAAILKASARNTPITRGVNLTAIAKELEHYSSADCAALVREAALVAMRRDLDAPRVTKADFDRARNNIRPSLNSEQVEWLENFAKEREQS
ncbi:AAA family ATPase [Antricoccus suffuscus]|uniref:AAA family ATPase n=1 Tax=Antricoccus suffuscus TaxID=1629062 RepID=UPI0014736B31|nr:AAA family ATPase [Antricoccus suffuscus]